MNAVFLFEPVRELWKRIVTSRPASEMFGPRKVQPWCMQERTSLTSAIQRNGHAGSFPVRS